MKLKIVDESFSQVVFNLPFFIFTKKNIQNYSKIRKLVFLLSSYIIVLIFKTFNESTFCFFMNIFYKSDGKIYWDSSKKIYYKVLEKKTIYYPNKYRISGSMVNQNFELNNLLSSYCLNDIEINDGDIIIDCGANIGSFFFAINQYTSDFSYVAYEPDPNVYKCLNLNLQNYGNVKIFNKALSHSSGFNKFYIESRYGDSSLEKFNSEESITVETTTLDFETYERVRLLKIDAEGHELGVLTGAKDTLKNTDYVCVDMGPEKGENNENTIPEVTNFLINNNFSLYKFNEKRMTGLFKNNLIVS